MTGVYPILIFTTAIKNPPANHFGLAEVAGDRYLEGAKIKGGLVRRKLCGAFLLPGSCLLFLLLLLVPLRPLLPARVKFGQKGRGLGCHEIGKPLRIWFQIQPQPFWPGLKMANHPALQRQRLFGC